MYNIGAGVSEFVSLTVQSVRYVSGTNFYRSDEHGTFREDR